MDDWELSAEELDSLERDALKQLAQRSSSSAAATTSHSNFSRPNVSSMPAVVPSSRSPAKPTFLSHPPVDGDKATVLTSKLVPKIIGEFLLFLFHVNCVHISDCHTLTFAYSCILWDDFLLSSDDPSKQQHPRITVKFFLHASGNIAAKFPYDKVLVGAFHNIPRASWNAKERLWMFPLSSLSTAEGVLRDFPGSNVEIENLDPLVRRAIAAATVLPDLQDRYEKIPGYIETKLLPFQRDGVRFVLQHGGRVLLADEMGLGKTLQAIAVTSCIREAWPVLILTPSSLRLQWASMIQQWLDIAPSDILWSGSNRGGFNIVPSNTRRPINLDGVFNIISYDTVPKLQDMLLASDFKEDMWSCSISFFGSELCEGIFPRLEMYNMAIMSSTLWKLYLCVSMK
ncbi:UNVERIFIED_CONTAM: SWI/SNF-related matrix-associated actin-dependent regulator of chromatin subfamily A-like protein 1 [Sesamum radiatum]|uniref:SWI/SNF-related matrix-associated actin-dependent regulator of chromatin subfamily A-like protein 1 n=1 Tax=Sesamum radiatum TaxID=300843 RepID=A0AAW2SKE5_SESRA